MESAKQKNVCANLDLKECCVRRDLVQKIVAHMGFVILRQELAYAMNSSDTTIAARRYGVKKRDVNMESVWV